MHVNESLVNPVTFVRDLKERAGYNTGMFGKYLNVMPDSVPPGFDAWMANGGGNYIKPAFQIMNVTDLVPGMQPTGKLDCWNGANHSHDAGYAIALLQTNAGLLQALEVQDVIRSMM